MDISGIDLALLLHLIVISLSFILMYITHCCFMSFDLVVSENKFSLICLTFTGTLNQPHFILLFMFASFRTIPYFSSSSHCFYGACLLACPKCTSVAACRLPAGARSSKFFVQISRLLTAETEPSRDFSKTCLEPRLEYRI